MDISAVMEQFPGETRTDDFKAALAELGAENMGAFAKGLVNFRNQSLAQNQSMTGQIKELESKLAGMVKVPGESATSEEMAAWRKAIGVPESTTGYGIEGDEITAKALHEAGIPKSAAEKFYKKLNEERTAKTTAEYQQTVAKLGERAEELIGKGLESAFPGEENSKVREQFSKNPVLAPLFHKLGKANVENPGMIPNMMRGTAEKRPYPSMDKAGIK